MIRYLSEMYRVLIFTRYNLFFTRYVSLRVIVLSRGSMPVVDIDLKGGGCSNALITRPSHSAVPNLRDISGAHGATERC